MNKAIELFGNSIYKLTLKKPETSRKILAGVFTVAGLQCKYFPTKLLLGSRQYMQWAAADSAIKPLRNPERSAIVSLYLPCEILHSIGMYEMFPEALACYMAAAASDRVFIDASESAGVPKTLCSYHRSFTGMVETGVLPKPKFIINTTLACDANHLSFRRAAAYYGVKQFVVDVPYEYSQENIDYVAEQLREMAKFATENSGYSLDEKVLAETVERSKRTLRNFKEMIEVRSERSLSDEMTSHMLSVFATHVMLGTPEAEKYSSDFLSQLKACPKGRKGVRLLWVHTLPYWHDALRNLINFTPRCEIVACDMTFDWLGVNLEEKDPYRFMADRLLCNTANGAGENRIKAVERCAKLLNADGVVWYCHWGCKQTAGLSALAKDYLEKQGLPTLVLDGDGCDTRNVNDGQTVTRMEAFLELLENKK